MPACAGMTNRNTNNYYGKPTWRCFCFLGLGAAALSVGELAEPSASAFAASAKSISSVTREASCSAFFLLPPCPRPYTRPSTRTSTVNTFWCSGPDSSTTTYSGTVRSLPCRYSSSSLLWFAKSSAEIISYTRGKWNLFRIARTSSRPPSK